MRVLVGMGVWVWRFEVGVLRFWKVKFREGVVGGRWGEWDSVDFGVGKVEERVKIVVSFFVRLVSGESGFRGRELGGFVFMEIFF